MMRVWDTVSFIKHKIEINQIIMSKLQLLVSQVIDILQNNMQSSL